MKTIPLGFEVGTGVPVSIPLRNLAVTGQTQESGKTTTLEALAVRSGARVLTFVTKRGENAFARGHKVRPYFRDRADWQFVMGLIETLMQEKNRFLRQYVIPLCRTTRTLKQVQAEVNKKLGKSQTGIYVEIAAYLELVMHQIEQITFADALTLRDGLNVMDLGNLSLEMQMLLVQSAIDWVNEHERDVVVVIPEAWEFIPEGKGSPVKPSAIALTRKGSAIGNHIWIDSQDMAGVDKTIARGCPVILVGVQREINEVKRNLANIPSPGKKLKPADVQMLERGQFFACHGQTLQKVYVQPVWMDDVAAKALASGKAVPATAKIEPPRPAQQEERQVDEKEARALRAENEDLKRRLRESENSVADAVERLNEVRSELDELKGRRPDGAGEARAIMAAPAAALSASAPLPDRVALIRDVIEQIKKDPVLIKLATAVPEIEVTIHRVTLEMDGTSQKGRVAKLLADGFFDNGVTNNAIRMELKRTGPDVSNANIGRYLADLLAGGFVTLESGDRYKSVAGMKVNIKRVG